MSKTILFDSSIKKYAYREASQIYQDIGASPDGLSYEQVEAMIAERQAARKARDFAKADAIRDRLAAMGIELMDTKEGVKWKKKS